MRLARQAAEDAVLRRPARIVSLDGVFSHPRGAFVTLARAGQLRGCVGFVEPSQALREVLRAAARGAARDPRFPPVLARELAELTVEVSVLSPPRAVAAEPEALPGLLRIGQHGLIVRRGRRRGLLLPQVPVEHGFTAEEFLAACCAKAGLDRDAWRGPGLDWQVFEAQVFEEESPRGAVRARGDERPEVA